MSDDPAEPDAAPTTDATSALEAPTAATPVPEAPTTATSADAAALDADAAADTARVDVEEDELVVLDALEADLAAVEQAISTLEQVAVDGIGGEQAAAQIAAAVSAERFGSTAPAGA